MRLEPLLALLSPFLLAAPIVAAQEPIELVEVPFDGEHWNLAGSEVVEYLGRTALRGGALLKDVELKNGIVEVDVAVTGARCFPAINVRRASASMYEDFYLRPHSSRKPDAVQYAPTFNGQAEWQLCNGEGLTAAAPIPWNEWIHLRLEIHARHPIPDPGFPNDVAFDAEGAAYISDGRQGRIYRFAGESVEVWFDGLYGFQPNMGSSRAAASSTSAIPVAGR